MTFSSAGLYKSSFKSRILAGVLMFSKTSRLTELSANKSFGGGGGGGGGGRSEVVF